jgi:hypothetical protein
LKSRRAFEKTALKALTAAADFFAENAGGACRRHRRTTPPPGKPSLFDRSFL